MLRYETYELPRVITPSPLLYLEFLANVIAIPHHLPEEAGSKRDSGVASHHVIGYVDNVED